MPLNQYHVVMEVAPEYQRDPDALKNIYVKSTTGAMVPLSAVTHFEKQRIPLAVNHQSQSPATTLSLQSDSGRIVERGDGGDRAGAGRYWDAVDDSRRLPGNGAGVPGVAVERAVLILLALVAVYIVLGMLYESFIHPLTILSTLPSAGVGAIVALLLFKVELSVIAMIGIILLIGIVKKNAIMMIDFALVAEREQRQDPAGGDL